MRIRKFTKICCKTGLFLTVFVLFSGCARTPRYAVPEDEKSAQFTVSSTQNYVVFNKRIYFEFEGRVISRQFPFQERILPAKTYRIAAGAPIALDINVYESDSYFGLRCHFNIIFTPEDKVHYLLETTIDPETQICVNQFKDFSGAQLSSELRVVDALYVDYVDSDVTKGRGSNGAESAIVADPKNIETTLYRYTYYQNLYYDYTPKALERRQRTKANQ